MVPSALKAYWLAYGVYSHCRFIDIGYPLEAEFFSEA